MEDLIDLEWLNEFKSIGVVLNDLYSQEFVDITYICQDEILFPMLHRSDECVNGLHGSTNDDAIINICEDDHVFLHVKAPVDF